jgi:OmpA-OmpF porin, OOP family
MAAQVPQAHSPCIKAASAFGSRHPSDVSLFFKQRSIMKKYISISLITVALVINAGPVPAQTRGIDSAPVVGYAGDQRANVVRSGSGLCWRTGYWTPAMATAECDPDLLPKVAAAEPPPKPAQPVATVPKSSPKPVERVAVKVDLGADALFETNRTTLSPEGQAKVDALIAKLGDTNLADVRVTGHADRRGSSTQNQRLSEQRAQAVKARLIEKGVEPHIIHTEGKGSTEPITKMGECKGTKKTLAACLQRDRRVEIEAIGTH